MRMRWRLKTAMIGIATLAILMGGLRWSHQRSYCRNQIAWHTMNERQALRLAARLEVDAADWERGAAEATPGAIARDPRLASASERAAKLRSDVASLRREAAYHSRWRRTYERAAANPWAPVPRER